MDIVEEQVEYEEEEEKIISNQFIKKSMTKASFCCTSSTPSSSEICQRKCVNIRVLLGICDEALRNEILKSLIRLKDISFYHSLL
jgi:hypothetical protein